jgi:hypothetical protein
LRCSAREIDSSTQPNKHEKRNIGRALMRADRKTSARFITHENWDNEETQGGETSEAETQTGGGG